MMTQDGNKSPQKDQTYDHRVEAFSEGMLVQSHRRVYVCVRAQLSLFANLWTIAQQVLLAMGFSRQEHRAGYHFLFQGTSQIRD